VINNAGVVVPGPVEHVSPADWRRQFDINFFGMIELTRAMLPLLRKAAGAHGAFVPRLLFVSSIGGRISQPILAPYTTSKFATTALGDALRIELRRQGIGVTVIEPGAVSTEIWAKGDDASSQFGPAHPARVLYGPEIDGITAASKRISSKAITADRAAQEIVQSILRKKPESRRLVGSDAKTMALLRGWLPLSWFDGLLMKEFGIAGLPVTTR
jgi:NAD(P)-dependent dehydrogenase (short-subunit alcohol dehydrogenase family)